MSGLVTRCIACTIVAACATAVTFEACAGDWIADKSGCRVWNPNPQLEESVTWSGSCANGLAEGHGTARWLKGNAPMETDDGEWHEGRQVNKGSQSWSTGRYDGELSDGEPNGRGVLTVQKLRYEGDFRNGKPNRAWDACGRERDHKRYLEGRMPAGSAEGLDRRSLVGLPVNASAGAM